MKHIVTIRLSPKGRLMIPGAMRRRLDLEPETERVDIAEATRARRSA